MFFECPYQNEKDLGAIFCKVVQGRDINYNENEIINEMLINRYTHLKLLEVSSVF